MRTAKSKKAEMNWQESGLSRGRGRPLTMQFPSSRTLLRHECRAPRHRPRSHLFPLPTEGPEALVRL